MPRPILTILTLALCVACSRQSPVTPTPVTPTDVPGDLTAKPWPSTSVAGAYDLGFFKSVRGRLETVASLPFGQQELILGAHVYVQGYPELPAQGGSVTFEYCSLVGVPSNDPTRIDEAPLEACADGSASWARLTTVSVNKAGNAYMNFGVVRYTPVIGFRCRYSERGSGVASGDCAARNFYWY